MRQLWALLGLLLLTSCGQQEAPPGMEGFPTPEVEVVAVKRATIPVIVELPARLQAVRQAEVRARVEGILEKRLFKEGTDVKEGEVLFQIASQRLAAAVEKAKAEVAQARADATFAKQTADRYANLITDKAVSQQAYDEVLARHHQAEAAVLAAEAVLQSAEVELGYATVTAPISGRIGRALVTEGMLVRQVDATHLATIEQLNPIWAYFTQSSSEFLKLRKTFKAGQVKIILEDGSEYKKPGKLLFTESTIDPATGSVAMRAEFPNSEKELLPGQFTKIKLTVSESKDVLLVPQMAVQSNPQGLFVWIVGADNKLESRPVKTGDLSGQQWMVTEGLKEGEQVVVTNLQKIQPGMVVKIKA